MNPDVTQLSLLSRVRDPANAAAWREFEERYRELLLRFFRGRGLQHADAEDLVQVVMANLARSMSTFVYDRSRGRFRDYLHRCARNAASRHFARPNRGQAALDTSVTEAVASPSADAVPPDEAAAWEQEWVAHHYRLAMEVVRRTFDARSVEVFERSLAGLPVDALGREYGMTEQAVHKVRQRIRKRMEELIAEQVREEDCVDG